MPIELHFNYLTANHDCNQGTAWQATFPFLQKPFLQRTRFFERRLSSFCSKCFCPSSFNESMAIKMTENAPSSQYFCWWRHVSHLKPQCIQASQNLELQIVHYFTLQHRHTQITTDTQACARTCHRLLEIPNLKFHNGCTWFGYQLGDFQTMTADVKLGS